MPPPAIATTKKTKGMKWSRKKQHGVKKNTGARLLGHAYNPRNADDDCLLVLMCNHGHVTPKKARKIIQAGGGGSGEWLRGKEVWGDDA